MTQYQTFKQIEETIEETLDNLSTYNKMNSLRANPENISHFDPSQELRDKQIAKSGVE